ncbi:HesA/MoeB/ThiF family protein [Cuniculiplasma sp. SKW3]|uniref:HesA/MoeB/ThiF family protein n=1 Tax=Cuniculiplasma sp. SKW3 TaxID=3400170 RepID=UPI003FD2F372
MGSDRRDKIIAIIGCGGNGQIASQILSSLGYSIILTDGDSVARSDLPRQSLFSEKDVGKNKSKVCAEKIGCLSNNENIRYEPVYLDSYNIEDILKDVDLIIDATDSFITRKLMNEFAVKHKIPLIFSSSFGSFGQIKCVIPHETSCLQCLFGEGEMSPLNCHYDRVLPYVPQNISAYIVRFAENILTNGQRDGSLYFFDFNNVKIEKFTVNIRDNCSVCRSGKYKYLEERKIQGRQII